MATTANVFEKLQAARVELQGRSIKKSGKNAHMRYEYFELGDFLPHVNEIFAAKKLCSAVSFTNELATLTIVNAEKPDESIVFTSPMAAAELKAAHAIQNLGAVETYQRRYLYMTALEIVEHDSLDAGQTGNGNGSQQTQQKPNTVPDTKGDRRDDDPDEAIDKGRKAYFAEARKKLPPIFGEEGPRNYAVWMAEGMLGRRLESFNDIPLDTLRRIYAHVKKTDGGDLANELRVMEEERDRTPDDVPFADESPPVDQPSLAGVS